MITVNTATGIDDAEFDRVYADSIDAMNSGTYPWEAYLKVTTDEEKKAHIRKLYDISRSNNLIIEVRDDDLLIALLLGQWHDEELMINAVLVSPDASGSKVWAYGEEYADARNAYWDSIGINGWTHRSSGEHSATHKYLLKCHKIGTLKASYEVKLVDHEEIPLEMEDFITQTDYKLVDVVLRKL